MATTTSHNKKSSAVKRILSEARELAADKSQLYSAAPLEDDIFEWHFTLRGPQSTEFDKGLYHGRILLPSEYPMRPPDLLLLTPNGRWELGKKICLTFTGFHEEMWQPAWGVRTALLGLQTFMTAKAEAAVGIGALNYPPSVRKKLALESRSWTCPTCAASNLDLLPDVEDEEAKPESLPPGLSVQLAPPSTSDPALSDVPLAGTSLHTSSIEPHSAPAVPPPPPVVPVQPQQHVSASQPVPAFFPPQAPHPLTQASSHFDSEQKLFMIDRLIALLVFLIALLVYKRLM